MNKSKKVELMAAIGSFKAEKIALNARLARYQAELAAARERISGMEERISGMEERFELIAVLAGSQHRRDLNVDPPQSERQVAGTVEIREVSAIRRHR